MVPAAFYFFCIYYTLASSRYPSGPACFRLSFISRCVSSRLPRGSGGGGGTRTTTCSTQATRVKVSILSLFPSSPALLDSDLALARLGRICICCVARVVCFGLRLLRFVCSAGSDYFFFAFSLACLFPPCRHRGFATFCSCPRSCQGFIGLKWVR